MRPLHLGVSINRFGVAAGVRRIEALTGEAACQFLLAQAGVAKTLAQSFKVQPLDVPARVEALTTERRALEKQVADLKKQLALGGGSSAGPAVVDSAAWFPSPSRREEKEA